MHTLISVDDLQRRQGLAERVCGLLQNDSRVITLAYYGSTASGREDHYSDIDIEVQLQDISDRAFAQILPELVSPIGSLLVEGWSLGALPDLYVRTFYFTDYPLFWHVDIACKSEQHIDGSDLKQTYHWPQIFKIWIDVVSNFLRGQDTTSHLEAIMQRWADLSPVQNSPPDVKLSHYLNLCVERARTRGAPCEPLYQRCDELRRAYLQA